MRNLTFAILFAAAVVAQAPSAKAQIIEFAGSFVLAKLNQTCIDAGWTLGDRAMARFTPPKIGDNGSSTRLSYFFTNFAENYTLPKGSLSSKFKKVNGVGIGRGPFSFNSKMRVTRLSPKNIKASTTFIEMAGNIQDFDGIAGCNISFRGGFARRF